VLLRAIKLRTLDDCDCTPGFNLSAICCGGSRGWFE
jgi:hypothetical protein